MLSFLSHPSLLANTSQSWVLAAWGSYQAPKDQTWEVCPKPQAKLHSQGLPSQQEGIPRESGSGEQGRGKGAGIPAWGLWTSSQCCQLQGIKGLHCPTPQWDQAQFYFPRGSPASASILHLA